MIDPKAVIIPLMEQTASAVGKSLALYWPSDADGRNDASERNLSIHFSHALLSQGYAVFAEAESPSGSTRLDILGISPSENWYIAGEFKRYKTRNMIQSAEDVGRVSTFCLNSRLRAGRVGPECVRFVEGCTQGIGLVAGLTWVPEMEPGSRAASLSADGIEGVVQGHGGVIGDPIHVIHYFYDISKGSYYLQYAYFPIPVPPIL